MTVKLIPICTRYSTRAALSDDGSGSYLAIYGLVGKDEQFVRNIITGNALQYEKMSDALAAAGTALAEALNGRALYKNKRHYEHMSGAELAVALRTLGLKPHEFAEIYGTTQHRVLGEWIDQLPDKSGQSKPIPPSVRILIDLFTDQTVVGHDTVGRHNLRIARMAASRYRVPLVEATLAKAVSA